MWTIPFFTYHIWDFSLFLLMAFYDYHMTTPVRVCLLFIIITWNLLFLNLGVKGGGVFFSLLGALHLLDLIIPFNMKKRTESSNDLPCVNDILTLFGIGKGWAELTGVPTGGEPRTAASPAKFVED